MLYIFILLYFPAVILSFAFVRSETSKIWRAGLIACFPALIIAVLFLALFWGEQMGGLFYAAILLVLVVPIFLLGVGVSLGSGAKVLLKKGHTFLSILILGSAIVLPGLGFGSTIYKIHQKNERRAAGLIQTQSRTVAYRLGSHDLNVAISPQLEFRLIFENRRIWSKLRHYCLSQKDKNHNHPDCSNITIYEEGEDKDLAVRPDLSANFVKNIKLRMPKTGCKSSPTHNMSSCVNPVERQAWCERRPDVADSIWCTNTLTQIIQFEQYVELTDFSARMEARNWIFHSTLSEMKDIHGNPIEIKCNRTRDNILIERKENPRKIFNGPHKRYCRIKYRIETDIEVDAKYNVNAPETLVSQAQDAYDYAQAFWHDMKTRELQSLENAP